MRSWRCRGARGPCSGQAVEESLGDTPGPAGDPFGSFVAPVTGFYTVAVGGSLSEEGGLYGYQITASVPEPETWALWGLGLAALTLRRRRRQD